MTRIPTLAVLAVVLRGDRVLLVRRRNPPDAGLWGFPGGRVEWGETALAAAARELEEETGIIGEPVEYVQNLDLIGQEPGGEAHHYFLVAVRCQYRRGEPAPKDDVDEARWCLVEDVLARRMPMSENVETVLWQAALRSGREDR